MRKQTLDQMFVRARPLPELADCQYLTDIRYFFDAGKYRAEAYAGATQPAGRFLVVTALAWPGMLIEVDVTASTAK